MVLVAWLLSRKYQGDPSLLIEPQLPSSKPAAKKRKQSTPMRWTGVTPPLARSFAWNARGQKGIAAGISVKPIQQKQADPRPMVTTDPPGNLDAQRDRSATDQARSYTSLVQLRRQDNLDISADESQRGINNATPTDNQLRTESHESVGQSEEQARDAILKTIGMLPELLDQLGDYLCLLECAPIPQAQALFGSASRTQGANDTMDEAQWVCSELLEKAFGDTLPNECARLHDKCFGPEPISAILSSPRVKQPNESTRSFQRTKSAPSQAVLKPTSAQQDETRTTIRSDRRQREVHMPRQFKRSASIASTASSSTVSLHKRKRAASRWEGGKDAQTLVLATPTKQRASSIPTKLEQFTPSPPDSIAHDSSTDSSPSPSTQRSPELKKNLTDSSLKLFKTELSLVEPDKSYVGFVSDAGVKKLQNRSQFESAATDVPTQSQPEWPTELLNHAQSNTLLQEQSVGSLQSRVSPEQHTNTSHHSNPQSDNSTIFRS
ncbi:hypothetical protein MPSI1_002924 [Malassezia psittaci]|uniref:Uncharacterized protein n=1 Tax=Malassezia psittaci TaxID=1821823 RepID=A0AAF0FGQ8_9BASI|nr:hypothetical protein MPSI1_002924 [Malassezia psittaci]